MHSWSKVSKHSHPVVLHYVEGLHDGLVPVTMPEESGYVG